MAPSAVTEEPPFVFFLHVPRTAGKTYSTCFLSASTRPSKRCMPGYDRYRYPQSPENCRYYVSHDDLSFIDNLPDNIKNNIAVVTQLRDPVKRAISAYEFGIEVAGRKINSSDETIESLKNNLTAVNTYNVWPWKYIVPFARNFIRERLDAITEEHGETLPFQKHVDPATNRTYYYDREKNVTSWEMPLPHATLNAYDNELTMPLREWIETDEVEELIHNGHTLQVLGISNTSFWEEASDLRYCFMHHHESRRRMLEMAKEKMSQMSHVGLQDELHESVASLAASLGKSMNDTVYKSIPLKAYIYDEKSNIPNLDMMVTFTSAAGEGKYRSMSIRNARYLMHNLTVGSSQLQKQIKQKQKQLNAWLEKEEIWLEKKEAERNSTLRWKFRQNVWKPLKRAAKWLHVKSIASFQNDNSHDEYEYEDMYGDEYQKQLLNESPLNDNITTIDKELARLQETSRNMSRDYYELKKMTVVTGVSFGPDVRAFVPFPDQSQAWINKTLGEYFGTCSRDSYSKGKKKKGKPFALMRNEKNQGFSFSPALSQNKISEEVQERIKELNAIDYELIEFGKRLFKETVQAQKQKQILETLPRVDTPKPKSREQQHTEL